uniref:Uncharacterized protein n=1 Tax=uncultured bacterium A1Q1_fos_1053 TaxID=1256539 RepID=L7VW64_9BACT|nr:hypothetical protein [uncultured bacterium A1Q1_fos_1053]
MKISTLSQSIWLKKRHIRSQISSEHTAGFVQKYANVR